MRYLYILLSILCLQTTAAEETKQNWQAYPDTLPTFDYSGEQLKQNWPLLAAGTRLPWPDEAYIAQMIEQYPQLHGYGEKLIAEGNDHPALKAALNNDFELMAKDVQNVWRLHFEGQYQQAYELGMDLGPAGYLPALYSKLIYITFLVSDPEEKIRQFLEVNQLAIELKPLAAGYAFLEFGDAYEKARRLELMPTSTAGTSGLLSPTMETLEALYKADPDSPLYPAMLGGMHAGVIERVGSFVGSITYGVSEDEAIEMFEAALAKESRLPVLYNEYAQALSRIDEDDYKDKIKTLYQQCSLLTPHSAEEALNQSLCIEKVSAF